MDGKQMLGQVTASFLTCLISTLIFLATSLLSFADTIVPADYGRGLSLVHQHRYREALAVFNHVLALKPDFAPCHLEKARIYLQFDKWSEAANECTEGIKLDPRCPGFYELRARSLENSLKFEEAIRDMDKAVELMPKNYDFWMFRGELNVQSRQYPKAIDDYSEAIKIRPWNDLPYRARSRVYYLLHKDNEAIDDLNRAIKNVPNGWAAYIDRARSNLRLGQFEKAVADCNYIYSRVPNKQGDILKLRAQAYDALGRKDLAEKDRQQLHQIDDFQL